MNTEQQFLINSKTLFIEYDDIIRANQLVLLFILSRKGCPDANLFDVELLQNYNALGLTEWYLHRPFNNICKCLCKNKSLPEDKYTQMVIDLMEKYSWCYSSGKKLDGANLCAVAIEHKLCKDIYIYSDYTNPVYVKDVQTLFGNKPIIVGQDFERCIRNINTDTTYILSDPNKIKTLYEKNKINCTSILLGRDCDYQKTPEVNDTIEKYLEDFDNHPVKFSYFNPVTHVNKKSTTQKQ